MSDHLSQILKVVENVTCRHYLSAAITGSTRANGEMGVIMCSETREGTVRVTVHRVATYFQDGEVSENSGDCEKDSDNWSETWGKREEANNKNEPIVLNASNSNSTPSYEGDGYPSCVREGTCRLSGMKQQLHVVTAPSASCQPRSLMWCPREEQGGICWKSRQTLQGSCESAETQAFPNTNEGWDAEQDNKILKYYTNRHNLILDSVCPTIAPHIVITPAEETWDSQSVAWNNRVDSQWTADMVVPIINTIWLPSPYVTLSNPPTHLEHLLLSKESDPNAVFSISKFNRLIESASVERFVMSSLIKTLQKQRCRVAYFEASIIALSFRERYDVSLDLFRPFDEAFVWSDPAEPFLLLNAKACGTTIIDSPCPFRVPHIIINAPPPQDFGVKWNNETSDPQDQGYGRYLVVPSSFVEVVNSVEDAEWDIQSSYFSLTVDQSETPSTRPGTPLPDTPIDECDDLDYFLTRHGDSDSDMSTSFCPQSFLSETITPFESLIEVNKSRPVFFIEEDDEDLPPFDDWYQQ